MKTNTITYVSSRHVIDIIVEEICKLDDGASPMEIMGNINDCLMFSEQYPIHAGDRTFAELREFVDFCFKAAADDTSTSVIIKAKTNFWARPDVHGSHISVNIDPYPQS